MKMITSKPFSSLLTAISLLFILFSCAKNSVSHQQNAHQKEIIITYGIEEISTEGAEAIVTYRNNKIYQSKTKIYGETGQAELFYQFYPTKIEVVETLYRYPNDLTTVSSPRDFKLQHKITYSMDYEGKILSKTTEEPINIFKEFKKTVPFHLKITHNH